MHLELCLDAGSLRSLAPVFEAPERKGEGAYVSADTDGANAAAIDGGTRARVHGRKDLRDIIELAELADSVGALLTRHGVA